VALDGEAVACCIHLLLHSSCTFCPWQRQDPGGMNVGEMDSLCESCHMPQAHGCPFTTYHNKLAVLHGGNNRLYWIALPTTYGNEHVLAGMCCTARVAASRRC
jgi:hypothetical protein